MAEPNDPIAPLRDLLATFVGTQTQAAAPASATSAQGPRRPSTPAVVTPTAAAAPPAPAQADQSQPSLLASLREAVAQDVAPLSSSERMGAFGRGVLSGRGSFLDNLSAGLAAQGQAEAARRAEMRQSIETQARLAEMDRKAQLEKAKFSEETTPGTLTGRLTEARIRQADAAAAQANRPQYQIVGTDAQGNAVVVDMRDPTRTRTLEGVRPTRSEAAEAAATRARIEAANRAGNDAVRIAAQTGQVRAEQGADEDKKQRIYQEAFQRTLRSMEEARPAPGARGGQQSPPPTEGGEAGRIRLPNL